MVFVPAVTQLVALQPIENSDSPVPPIISYDSAVPFQCITMPREHENQTSFAERPVTFHTVPVSISLGTPATNTNAVPR